MRIVCVVEGHGEVEAAPELLRRIIGALSPETIVECPRPIRVARNKIIKAGELERVARFAASGTSPDDLILVLLDADADCPAGLGPSLLVRAQTACPDRCIRVVLARREFEAWFLAAAESLSGRRGLKLDLSAPDDPESIRDAKAWLSAHRQDGHSYRETVDQTALAAGFDLDRARARSPSFAKLWRDVKSALRLPPQTGAT